MTALLPDYSTLARDAARGVSLVCALRGLPFLVYACLSPRRTPASQATAVLVYLLVAGVAFALRPDTSLLWCAAGALFYLACGCALPECARLLRAGRITRPALFAVFALCFVLLPGALVPNVAAGTFLVLGWELLLSGYSYCADVARTNAEPSRADCLFFLFVDPNVSYSLRSRPLVAYARAPKLWGSSRALLGVATMLAASALLRPAYQTLGELRAELAFDRPFDFALALCFALARFAADYAAHSGLASIQIGLMQRAGYAPRERYRRPFLATDPLDFWRRWNTYVAAWLRLYVFVPSARRLKTTALPGPLALAVVVLSTVLASGMLHDGYGYAADHVFRPRALGFFAANGVAILLWAAAGKLSHPFKTPRWLRFAGVSSRLLFLSALLGACWVWG